MWPSDDGSGGHGGPPHPLGGPPPPHHNHPPMQPPQQPFSNGGYGAPPVSMFGMVPNRPPPLVGAQRNDVRQTYRPPPAAPMQPPYWHDPRMAPPPPQPMVQPSTNFNTPPPYVWDPQQAPQWQPQAPPPQWNGMNGMNGMQQPPQQQMPMMSQPPPPPPQQTQRHPPPPSHMPPPQAQHPPQFWHDMKAPDHGYAGMDNGGQPVFPRNWSDANIPKPQQPPHQHKPTPYATNWENPKVNGGNGGNGEWNGMGGGHSEWNNGGAARHNENWGGPSHDERVHHNRYETTSAAVGSWNPNEVQETSGQPDMVWRDPNPKMKKPQRDMGTGIWGDPTQQNLQPGSINNWTRPDNAPPDFNWEAAVTSAVVSNPNHGFGWNDPIPSDRTPRDSHLEMHVGSPSEASLQAMQVQLETAVRKGLLPATVLQRLPQSPASLIDLNELLRWIAKIETLQLEKDRLLTSQMTGAHKASMLSNIEVQIHQAKTEFEKARASAMKDEGYQANVERSNANSERNGSTGSKLQQWKRGQAQLQSMPPDAIVDQITIKANKMTLDERRGVTDWLEASPGPGEQHLKEDGTPLEGLSEFVPGKAWNWTDPNKIAEDPNITPGQVKSSPLVSLKGVNGDSTPWAVLEQHVHTETHDGTMWLAITHLNQPIVIYQMCSQIGNIVRFLVHETYVYLRWAPTVNITEARATISQTLPEGSSVRLLREDQVSDETRQNDK